MVLILKYRFSDFDHLMLIEIQTIVTLVFKLRFLKRPLEIIVTCTVFTKSRFSERCLGGIFIFQKMCVASKTIAKRSLKSCQHKGSRVEVLYLRSKPKFQAFQSPGTYRGQRMTYAELITEAIKSSANQRLTLQQIYSWMIV